MSNTWILAKAASKYGLAGIVATINPKAWDAVVPHGPAIRTLAGSAGRASVTLDPQPEPPRKLALGIETFLRVAQAAIATRGGMSEFADDVDDWCGTGWPHRIPHPHPDPEPNWHSEGVFLGAALAAAALASHYPAGEMRTALEKAGEKLAAQVPLG